MSNSTPVTINGALVSFDPVVLKGDPGGVGTPGATGPAGAATDLTIGTVTSVPSGQSASASITGTAPNKVLNLVLVDGPDGQVSSGNNVVLGNAASATVDLEGQVAVGKHAEVSAGYAIAIGDHSSATDQFATAIGQAAEADGEGSVAINGEADTFASIAIGPQSVAGGGGGTYAIAIGGSATAPADNTVAIGIAATASGAESIAIGDSTSATAAGSVAIGAAADGTGASSSTVNLFVLGTSQHTVSIPGLVLITNLPTSDPANAGQLWNDTGTLKVSAG